MDFNIKENKADDQLNISIENSQQKKENSQPKEPQKLKFVCISDTHGVFPEYLESGDVLIHCGDFTHNGEFYEVENFYSWLLKQNFTYKIHIAGNHDFCYDTKSFPSNKEKVEKFKEAIKKYRKDIIYLENQGVTINGIKIWGSPYNLYYWRKGAFQIHENKAQEIWNQIPDGVDIVLTHGPPYGHGDISQSEINGNVGDKHLLNKIKQIKPKYHIFGHIHEGYGITKENDITFINCAYLKKNYQVGNKEITFTF